MYLGKKKKQLLENLRNEGHIILKKFMMGKSQAISL
jgi:hypothetical protein